MSIVAKEPVDEEGKVGKFRIVAAGLVGNILEWYDFALYGFFAPTIGTLFFPAADTTTSLIAAFGAFAAGFLMRPVGAVLFGQIGDRIGRRKALVVSITMMAVPTMLMGLLPTYAEIGIYATILMIVMRMVQGISAGGEYASSFVFLVEHAPSHRRVFFGAWCMIGGTCGNLLGSAVGAFVNSVTTTSQLQAWGWRIPFLSGILVALVGYLIRRGIPEQPLFKKQDQQRADAPLKEAWITQRKELFQSAGLNMMNAVTFFTVFIYLSTWMVQEAGESRAVSLDINTVSMAALAILIPFAALLADKFGRKPLLLFGAAGVALLSPTLLRLMHHHDVFLILTGQLGFAILVACVVGVVPATTAELFQRSVRVSAAGLSYNIPFTIFGGTAPLVAAWLVKTTGNPLSITWYLSGIAAISFCVILTLKESKDKPLDE